MFLAKDDLYDISLSEKPNFITLISRRDGSQILCQRAKYVLVDNGFTFIFDNGIFTPSMNSRRKGLRVPKDLCDKIQKLGYRLAESHTS